MPIDPKLKTCNTPKFRANYPKVFTPEPNKLKKTAQHPDGVPQYAVEALFELGADLKPLERAVMAAIAERLGEDQTKWPKTVDGKLNLKLPFRLQDERIDEKTKGLKPGYTKGAIFCTLSTNANPKMPPPGVFDQQNQKILPSDETKIYSGCWLIANVTAGFYPPKGVTGIAPGVKLYLNGVQLVADGEPLGGRARVEDAFSPIEGAAEGQPATSLFGNLT